MSKVVLSDRCALALQRISKYIATESGSRKVASDFLIRIDKVCQQYANQPLMGESRPEISEHTRSFHVGNYVVFYRPIKDGVFLDLIIHGSRDISFLNENSEDKD